MSDEVKTKIKKIVAQFKKNKSFLVKLYILSDTIKSLFLISGKRENIYYLVYFNIYS